MVKVSWTFSVANFTGTFKGPMNGFDGRLFSLQIKGLG